MKLKRIILPIVTLGVMGFALASCGSETDTNKNNNSQTNNGSDHTHTYGDWTTTKEATESEKGSREKTCTVCGDKVTEEIAKLDHDYEITYEWNGDLSKVKLAKSSAYDIENDGLISVKPYVRSDGTIVKGYCRKYASLP